MGWAVAGNIKGPTGDTGPKGDTGDTGATGPTGATGASGLNWQGPWDSSSTYAVNDGVSYGGSSWFASAAHGANELPTDDPTDSPPTPNAGWELLSLHGATGATGATGPKGDQGDKGDTGDTGPQGIQGATGATGPTGATGATGARGSNWYTGTGAPGTIAGSAAGDQYLDTNSGDVYSLS